MSNERSGKPIGGGLVFTGEFDRARALSLANSYIKDIHRRFPTIIVGNVSTEDWTIYGHVNLEQINTKTNIFYIPTDHFGKQGNITLNVFPLTKKSISIKFEVEDGDKSFFLETRHSIKEEIRFMCTLTHREPRISMCINNGDMLSRKLVHYSFPPTKPNLIIWNKFNQLYIKEAAFYIGKNNESLDARQKKLLTA